jgi:hypothetical protein
MNTTWWGQTTHQLKDSHFVPHYHLESFDQEKADGKTLSKEEIYIYLSSAAFGGLKEKIFCFEGSNVPRNNT